MTRDLIRVDSRLFLFQVLEYGINENLIDNAFLSKLKIEGAQMSYVFAKRYYNVVYEASLKQASHCVLGIMNISLIESSRKQLDAAIGHILQKGYVGVFREGWTRLSNLVRYTIEIERDSCKTVFEWEKDFAELFSAEPGRKWIGYDEYRANMLLYYSNSRRQNGSD